MPRGTQGVAVCRIVVAIAAGVAAVSGAWRVAAQAPLELRWGGDAEGGAPFVEADPRDPAKLEGFDVEIAAALAPGLGRTPPFVQAWGLGLGTPRRFSASRRTRPNGSK
jgi:ABC-type amino acid transport substrate-binding protein